MGRYLIIDTHKIEQETSENVWFQELLQSSDKPILSEEESLAKFKEVWTKGRFDGISMMMQNSTLPSPTIWDKVKEDL